MDRKTSKDKPLSCFSFSVACHLAPKMELLYFIIRQRNFAFAVALMSSVGGQRELYLAQGRDYFMIHGFSRCSRDKRCKTTVNSEFPQCSCAIFCREPLQKEFFKVIKLWTPIARLDNAE